MNKISVVILNYNGENLLREFLPSVLKYSGSAAIVIADNGSTDRSLQLLEKEFPTVRLIKFEQNFGFCGGYNRALKQIQSDYYVLLNSDVEVTSEWLNPLEKLLSENKTIAAIQPKILSYHDKKKFEYAGAGGGFIDSLGFPFCRGRLFDYCEDDNGQYNDTREIFWATGACMMIRSDVYHQLGGLDENFFAHMEEIDLCWRIQRKGLKVFYCGTSHVYHIGAGTLSRSSSQKTYLNFRNGLGLLIKNASLPWLIFKLPLRIFLDYIAAIKFLLEGNVRDSLAVLRAHFYSIVGLRGNIKKRKSIHLPFTQGNTYKGLIAIRYFVLKRKKVRI